MGVSGTVEDALSIWRAGVDAVRADRVVLDRVAWDGRWLTVDDASYDLRAIKQIVIVGAGKATYGMLAGLLEVFEGSGHPCPSLSGWINVPDGATGEDASGLGQSLSNDGNPRACPVHVHQARPQGINEPTQRVVEGSREILNRVQQSDSQTCVVVLLSGGGSALLSLPIDWISLEAKISITRRMSASGATIQELNEVRRCLSQIKGGGLARECHARIQLTFIISDVLGDPIEYIASGPTVVEPRPDPLRAAALLESLCPGEFTNIASRLRQGVRTPSNSETRGFDHFVLANNATAVDAAGTRAVELGYRYWMQSAKEGDGPAVAFGERFASQLVTSQDGGLVDCLISGGEPTVVLPPPELCGKGGRNQHVALAVANWLSKRTDLDFEFAMVSGGTDGEDGSTEAAGAWIDRHFIHRCKSEGIDLEDALNRCDSYSLFEHTGNLLITGPTHTNVCDLRVGLVSASDTHGRAGRPRGA